MERLTYKQFREKYKNYKPKPDPEREFCSMFNCHMRKDWDEKCLYMDAKGRPVGIDVLFTEISPWAKPLAKGTNEGVTRGWSLTPYFAEMISEIREYVKMHIYSLYGITKEQKEEMYRNFLFDYFELPAILDIYRIDLETDYVRIPRFGGGKARLAYNAKVTMYKNLGYWPTLSARPHELSTKKEEKQSRMLDI